MRKILIGISGKECSKRTVDFVGKQMRDGKDLEVTLAHVLPNLPAIFWDEGHILSDSEKQDRKRVVDTWLAKQRGMIEPLMKSAADGLAAAGIKPEMMKTQFISDSTDVADSLIEVARDGGYQVIVVSRCAGAGGRQVPTGSVPVRLLQKAAGISVCVVD
jgi:nucleotide-binding universal stress UspA family protein